MTDSLTYTQALRVIDDATGFADVVDLFDRRYELQVEDLLITSMQVKFEVKRSLSAKTANSSEVTVYNLGEDTRRRLHAMRSVFVSLSAGYAQGTSLIHRGDIREAWSSRDGNDWVTTISSDDGAAARKKQRINKSFPAGTSVQTVILECARALQVGLGNAQQKAATAKLWNTSPASFSTGYVASGDALSQLDRVCRSCGLEWSIQDNQLQLLDRGRPLLEDGILLSARSGLVDSPELGKGGVVRCRTLMVPGLYPGRRVKLQSRYVQGVFRIETTHHRGDFEGDEWGCELELKAVA
jgi:hypothetical protein